MLLEIAPEQSLEKFLRKLIDRAMEWPHIVCAQVFNPNHRLFSVMSAVALPG